MQNMIRSGLLLMGLVLLTQTASAQKDSLWRQTGRWSAWGVRYQTQTFGLSEGKIDTCNCEGGDRKLSERGNVGLLVSYYRSVNPRLAYSADFGFSYGRVGTTKVNTLEYKSKLFTSIRGDIYYHVGKERQLISPYLHTGIHAQVGSMYASLPLGAGMRWMMKKSPVFITTQIDYGIGLTANLRNNLITSLGIYVNLGSIKRPPAIKRGGGMEAPACDTDSDMDGIPDLLDGCPRLKGTKENNGCPACDSDNDGIIDEKDLCPTVPGSMSNQGCPVLDTDGDGVVDSKDLCPTVPGVVSNNGCPEEPKKAYVPATPTSPAVNSNGGKEIPEAIVYFDLDKYAIRKDAQVEIDRAVAFLAANSEYHVILKGHTDVRASFAYNEKLSQNRVNAVRAKLIAAGIDASRIKVAHFGEVTPAKDGDGEPNWQKNRRVEFTFVLAN